MPNSLSDHVARSLKALRKRLNVRQGELAQRIGFSLRHIQKIEAGEVNLNVNTLELFASALGTPPCHLLSRTSGEQLEEVKLTCPAQILELLHVGIHIISPEGRILYANRKSRENFGLVEADLSKPHFIWDFLYDKAEIPKVKEYIRRVVETTPEPTPYYAKHQYKNGEATPVKIDWNYIRNGSGRIIGLVSLVSVHPSW